VTLVNRSVTGAAGSATTISIERQHGTNEIVVTGSIPAGSAPYQDYATVWEPTGFAAAVFRDALSRHGVRVLGRTTTGATPRAARPVAQHESMTLAHLLVPFLKLSNNGHAEALTKAMGRAVFGEGSWDAGIRATAQSLGRLGVDNNVIRRVDGSGLSRQDLVSPTQITNLYRNAAARPWFAAWYDALPVAGAPDRLTGGTLRFRMRNTPAANNLRGKTGSLTGVSTLSGYVTDARGDRLIFSIMLNNQLSYVKDLEDAIGVTLASHSGDRPSTANGPGRLAPPSDVDPRLATHECAWIRAC
jgi:D-alanyl-D-alanine carboxypeptidase/D-alanyl-D-alanine-endopeptidase (penicillin-binding protein 4)